MFLHWLRVVCVVIVSLSVAAVPVFGQGLAQLVSVQKTWDSAPYNSFTDLVAYKGAWYCCFRESTTHGVALPGTIRILRSTNGSTWASVAALTSATEDLRDPHMVITPDNRLMLYAAAVTPVAVDGVTHRNFVWFSQNGTNWTQRTEIGEPNVWLWRITWHNGTAYGIGYQWTPTVLVRLYTSTDGTNFATLVSDMQASGIINETSRIIFLEDGTAKVLLRDSLWGTAQPPYTNWTWTPMGTNMGGPDMIRLPDGRFVAVTRLYDGIVRTSVTWVDPATGALTECLTLPSGGDTSYAGLVWYDDLLWISYYSSHEGKPSIYLAKVAFPDSTPVSVTDTFTRADNDALASTEQPRVAWVERQTVGAAANVASITGGQMLLFGVSTTPAGSGAGVAALDVDLPDLAISADLRFAINNPAQAFGNNTGGFLLRRPRSDGNIGDSSSGGQISVQIHPSGGIYIGQMPAGGGAISTLFADNPFVSGQQEFSQLNSFFGSGSLPTTLNGLAFDTDGDGVLELAEPFRVTAVLLGESLQVLINGVQVASATVAGTASTPSSFVALLKNRWTGNAAGVPSSVYFDNLDIARIGINDDCASALPITDGTIKGSTLGATGDGTASCGDSNNGPDVWYRYVAPVTGDLMIDTCGSRFDTVVSVLDGCGGQELICNDDCDGTLCGGPDSCLIVPVTQAQSYLVRVSGAQQASGDFTLRVQTQETRTATHRGGADPLTEAGAWTLDTNTSTGERTLVTGVSGRPHWQVSVNAGRRANYQHTLSPSQWSDPAGWTLTARVRAISALDMFQSCLEVNDDRDLWLLSLVTSGGTLSPGLWTTNASPQVHQQLATFDPSAGYHTIQMVYDPAADDGNGAVSFYLDGDVVGTQTRAESLSRSFKRVVWGDNNSGGLASDARYAFVQFETGQRPLGPCGNPFADTDGDEDVDQSDFGRFQACYGDIVTEVEDCACLDIDSNGEVDGGDFDYFMNCVSGPDLAATVTCDD